MEWITILLLVCSIINVVIYISACCYSFEKKTVGWLCGVIIGSVFAAMLTAMGTVLALAVLGYAGLERIKDKELSEFLPKRKEVDMRRAMCEARREIESRKPSKYTPYGWQED